MCMTSRRPLGVRVTNSRSPVSDLQSPRPITAPTENPKEKVSGLQLSQPELAHELVLNGIAKGPASAISVSVSGEGGLRAVV